MTYGEVCGASFVHMLRSLEASPGTCLSISAAGAAFIF